MYKVVVPVSGGKDSQACLKLAVSRYPRFSVLGLFCDTQFEHPLTYKHIDWMRKFYGVTIVEVCAGSVEEKVLKHKRFPTPIIKFCTEQLKIVPSKKFYVSLAEKQKAGFEVWYGLRWGESRERQARYADMDTQAYPPNEVLNAYPKYLFSKHKVVFRLPIIDWGSEQVIDFLNGEENPLYKSGFSRVGCFPCLAAGDKNKIKAFEFDEFGKTQLATVRKLEVGIGRSVFKNKVGAAYSKSLDCDANPGCSFCSI